MENNHIDVKPFKSRAQVQIFKFTLDASNHPRYQHHIIILENKEYFYHERIHSGCIWEGTGTCEHCHVHSAVNIRMHINDHVIGYAAEASSVVGFALTFKSQNCNL